MTSARRRGPGRAVGWRHAALALFLALPPAIRVARPYLPPPAPAAAGATAAAAMSAADAVMPAADAVTSAAGAGDAAPPGLALRSEVAVLREQLRRAQSQLELRGLAPADARYTIIVGDILPASDPSPTRSALWVWTRGAASPRDGAVLAQVSPPGGDVVLALAGRVHRAYPATPIVRARSLLDRDLRVRFRHQAASGMLVGSGLNDKGHALLFIRHQTATAELHSGEPVFTEGRDGVYPPDVLIGFLEERHGSADGERLVVRSAARLDELSSVLVVVDTQSQAVARLRAIDKDAVSRQGGPR